MRIYNGSARHQPFVEDSQAVIQLCPGNPLIEPLQPGCKGVSRNRLSRSWRSYPSANMPPIELTERQNLGGRAGEKSLVRGVQLIACDTALAYFEAQHLACQSYYAVAGNALQTGGDFRRVQYTIAQQKDVGRRSLRHIALRVEHDGLVKTRFYRRVQRQHGIDIVTVGFGPAQANVDVMPRPGGSQCTQAKRGSLRRNVLTQIPGGDHYVSG